MARISEEVTEKAYWNDRYIVSFKSVYQPFYSRNAGYYARELYYSRDKSLTKRGHVTYLTGDEVNSLIGIELLRNL